MALPKIELPIGELTLPSTGEKVKYRPFTVKEEKILLVGQQSDDPELELLSAKQVIGNCLIEKDVDELAMFDLEYALLFLRARSVNNIINFTIKDEAGNANSNTITVLTSNSQTIDGVQTISLESPYSAINIYCDGSEKFFIY